MAITIIGRTLCSLCNMEIKDKEVAFSFPPFIQNTKDIFYQFADSSFHQNCLENHILGKKAVEFAQLFFINTKPENRRCIVDKKIIQDYNDYIFIDLLTSDNLDELYNFNFTTLNKKNLCKWTSKESFVYLAKKFIVDGRWGDITSYKHLENLIELIENSKSI